MKGSSLELDITLRGLGTGRGGPVLAGCDWAEADSAVVPVPAVATLRSVVGMELELS